MPRILSLVLPLIAAVGSTAVAQEAVVAGNVRAADGLTPVAGATVSLLGARLWARSDSDGHFAIGRVPSGRYEIEVRRIGMSLARRVVVVPAGDTVQVDVTLADAAQQLVGIEVVGAHAEALSRLPGSAAVVSAEQLALQLPISANEALRTIPGVHLQEEEGAGLRANIGIRGLDPDRSRTVLVLEDGVPVALAPYGEPELYYSPPIDRMERVEIIKGSGSILFGPQTIGGVVNYVTADAPQQPEGQLLVQGGTGGSMLGRARYGGSWDRFRGTLGALRKQADDWNGLFYHMTDVTGTVGARTNAGDFGLKLSVYDEHSNATYVGLTDSLFRVTPWAHPQPGDRLEIRRYALTGTHEIGSAQAALLRTNLYAYRTTRDWNRRDYTYTASGSAYEFRPTTGGRNRAFDVLGIEPRLRALWSGLGKHHQLEAGLRAHVERARDRHVNGTADGSAPAIVRDDEKRRGHALAGFVQNRMFLSDAFHVTPGLRVEHFAHEREILVARIRREVDDSTVVRQPEEVGLPPVRDGTTELVPGIGAAWTPNPLATVFAGAHRGFAPPRTKDAIIFVDRTLSPDQQVPIPVSLQLDAERSWNYELGARVTPTRYLSLEATAFYLDFANQIIEPSASAGSVAAAALANQGATRHRGLEAAFSLDAAKALRRPWSFVAAAGYTYADAVFTDRRLVELPSGDTVSIEGNRLPYAPRHKLHASLTFAHPRGVTARVDGLWVGEQFADNFETRAASANGRTGLIPAYGVVDATVQIALPGIEGLTLLASVKNLGDQTYIASRRPEGIKVGLPRILSAGLVWDF